ncbi:MAG: fructose-6-phosphate aldolase [Clostridiales bacterium]|nr:fructose-6-phosphate aldolase [Clostridiales bacterium]
MKFFVDTANIKEIMEAQEWGIVDGVTTNPTLLAKEKENPLDVIKGIVKTVNGPVSVEVISTDSKNMVVEGRGFAKIADNIVIKIPITKEGLKATNVLSKEGIKVNVTLIFSTNQAILANKAGAAYVSPFIGRLDDIGNEGVNIVKDIVKIFNIHSASTEVIVASIRQPLHVTEAAKIGAHIATIPFNVLEKMVYHPLTDKGLTIFLDDWKKIKKRV